MSRKISKSEKRVLNNADIFYKLFNELNNSIEYVFIGFFANLAYNHFRGSAYFEILINQDSFDDLKKIMQNQNFNHKELDVVHEFFTNELLIKVWVNNDKKELKDRKELKLEAFGRHFNLFFPSLDIHKYYLNINNGFFGKEDIRILEKNKLEYSNEKIGFLFELYFYGMYLNIKHNHIEGSSSCPLCNQK